MTSPLSWPPCPLPKFVSLIMLDKALLLIPIKSQRRCWFSSFCHSDLKAGRSGALTRLETSLIILVRAKYRKWANGGATPQGFKGSVPRLSADWSRFPVPSPINTGGVSSPEQLKCPMKPKRTCGGGRVACGLHHAPCGDVVTHLVTDRNKIHVPGG